MGAAIRYITSAPVPVDHMMGRDHQEARKDDHGLRGLLDM